MRLQAPNRQTNYTDSAEAGKVIKCEITHKIQVKIFVKIKYKLNRFAVQTYFTELKSTITHTPGEGNGTVLNCISN